MKDLQMWYNGEFLKVDQAQVSLLEHGLHYGTGVFEGIRCYETENGQEKPVPCEWNDQTQVFANCWR